MKFRYTILINGTNGAVQKDIEADNISKATITAKARVREIWGLTAKLKQKIINREKDFYKDEYYSQNKETGRYKKEFTLMVKALNRTQDAPIYVWSCDLYVRANVKGEKGNKKVFKKNLSVFGKDKDDAKKNAIKKLEQQGYENIDISGWIKKSYKYSDSGSRVFDRLFKVLNKVQDDRQTENKFKTMEQIRNKKIGDEVKPKKIFNISAHLKGGDLVRKFIAIGANESEVKNKVKRLFLTRGEYDFIISENPTFSMERFNKLAQGKEVIRNELRS